jgi:hypothetical protein
MKTSQMLHEQFSERSRDFLAGPLVVGKTICRLGGKACPYHSKRSWRRLP